LIINLRDLRRVCTEGTRVILTRMLFLRELSRKRTRNIRYM